MLLSKKRKGSKATSNNGVSRKIVQKLPRNFAENRQYKLSETAFLAETVGNGVWDLVGDANSDPMVYKSSKSAFWRRKIQLSVKICKFGTISCESPLAFCFAVLVVSYFCSTESGSTCTHRQTRINS